MGTTQQGGVVPSGSVVCLVGDARGRWGLKGEGITMLVCLQRCLFLEGVRNGHECWGAARRGLWIGAGLVLLALPHLVVEVGSVAAVRPQEHCRGLRQDV
jgi:hypothetical protein